MRKDIFIDNNIAKNFTNPLDPEYKRLIQWLMAYNSENSSKNAYLMVSNKLIAEYQRTAGTSASATNITIIIAKMTREGRLIKITNEQIREFKRRHFTKRVERNLTCNKEDRDHIPVILLPERKYALCRDNQFIHDLTYFPGFVVVAEKRPQDIRYDEQENLA
ncbi:MAG: hypothetical protein HC887_01010 [Desulfobacteraceae bacterium]|nr:hypothetical protein [Desulfobacteraceae bacterium]